MYAAERVYVMPLELAHTLNKRGGESTWLTSFALVEQ